MNNQAYNAQKLESLQWLTVQRGLSTVDKLSCLRKGYEGKRVEIVVGKGKKKKMSGKGLHGKAAQEWGLAPQQRGLAL